MGLEHLIVLFGYPLILLGVFIEGETILILGGFAAHQGYLCFPLVILCAAVGAFAGDQFFFYLGRHKSRLFLARHPGWGKRITVIQRHLDRFQLWFVIGYRFIYGIRTVSPFVIGMGNFPTGPFIIIDALTVVAWATLMGTLGYLFGHAMEVILGDIERYELAIIGILAVAGLTVWLVHWRKKRAVSRPS